MYIANPAGISLPTPPPTNMYFPLNWFANHKPSKLNKTSLNIMINQPNVNAKIATFASTITISKTGNKIFPPRFFFENENELIKNLTINPNIVPNNEVIINVITILRTTAPIFHS